MNHILPRKLFLTGQLFSETQIGYRPILSYHYTFRSKQLQCNLNAITNRKKSKNYENEKDNKTFLFNVNLIPSLSLLITFLSLLETVLCS